MTGGCDRQADNAQDVADLLKHLGLTRVALAGSSYGGLVALEVAARWPETITALALLCADASGHVPSERRRSSGREENSLLEAGDLDGAVELNVRTFLGPDADEATADLVRRMQRRAFEVQLAMPEDQEQAGVEVDLSAITAPCLAVSGGLDLPDFREIAAGLPGRIAGARHLELPWAGHLPGLERPGEVTGLLIGFLRESLGLGDRAARG